MSAQPTVFLVDDDPDLRKVTRRLMESAGLPIETYADAHAFLAEWDSARPGCIVLDIKMPGMTGLGLQEELVKRGIHTPIIIISGHADVDEAVRAMKGGAIDLLRKPYKGQVLIDRIRDALRLDAAWRMADSRRAEVAARIVRLTPREREVMELLVAGQSSKEIAQRFGLSRKTVDVHRAHITAKMEVDSLVDLVNAIHAYRAAAQGPTHGQFSSPPAEGAQGTNS